MYEQVQDIPDAMVLELQPNELPIRKLQGHQFAIPPVQQHPRVVSLHLHLLQQLALLTLLKLDIHHQLVLDHLQQSLPHLAAPQLLLVGQPHLSQLHEVGGLASLEQIGHLLLSLRCQVEGADELGDGHADVLQL